ncbi:hypothetical protein [Embleya sp. NPDC005971]|uniref:hypothetical protein n=1 Tax=Embleya sp. NPDC005971 TaxID=3156724 RepID=UPI0034089ECF
MHLGEVLVVWDPGEWHGISSHGSADDTATVARAAERIAAEVADGRWILGADPDDGAPRPAGPDELARAVRAASGDADRWPTAGRPPGGPPLCRAPPATPGGSGARSWDTLPSRL